MRSALGTAVMSLALAGLWGCVATSPPPGSHPSSEIAGPQGTLIIDDGGRGGIPVLLVHGNGGNHSQWAAQLAHLRHSRRAVAFDLRGMGESARPADGDYSVEGFADDVAAVADALGLRRFVLVGHSYGGAVICAYAGKHPDRLVGVVFADSAGDLSRTEPERIEQLARGLAPETYVQFTDAWFESILKGSRPATHDAVMRSLHATRREVFSATTLSLYVFPFSESLARYPGPKLSIASSLYDSPFGVHQLIREVPARRIAGASHWLMMDQPEEFNRLLDDFVRGLD